MPIYAYRCEECGFAKDVLQKMSEDPLTICPECHQPSFKKQVTAAGFQLKGSGWYVTDFRGGNAGSTGAATAVNAKTEEQTSTSSATETPASTTGTATSTNNTSGSSSVNVSANSSTGSDNKAA